MTKQNSNYASSGVDYSKMDPVKVFAQTQAANTAQNLSKLNMSEVTESRGESAYVWDEGDCYKALVIEGLGTKNLVADATRKFTGKTHYDQIAQDTVAMIVNDLVTVGAKPMVVNAYFGIGSSDWLSDETRFKDLIIGWKNACDMSGAVYGGGETPTLRGVINPETIDLAGSAIGIIKPKEKLITQNKLQDGDSIIFIESSGIHANGLSLARSIAENHPDGYAAKLPNGSTYGEALLAPTHIYAKVIANLLDQNIDIHYISNITGHGWRKLMRANKDFIYTIENILPPQPVFDFIQKQGNISNTEMYANFNMGVGYALFLPKDQTEFAQKIISESGFKSVIAGQITTGPKKVIIKPLDIVFESNTLKVR